MERRQLLIALGAGIGTALLVWLAPMAPDDRGASLAPVLEPATVIWTGVVTGVMESGGALALDRGPDGLGLVVLSEPVSTVPSGSVTVIGTEAERSCAYRNTVFRGECVAQLVDARIDQSR